MANKKISQLPAVETPELTDQLACNQSGTSKQITVEQIVSLASGGGGGALLAVNNLDDLADVPTARSNLGLGDLATADSVDYSDLTGAPDLPATYAPIAKGVTNGDSHDHNDGDGGTIAYSTLSGKPTLGTAAAKDVGTGSTQVAAGDHLHTGVYEPANANIQTAVTSLASHVANVANPHAVTAAQVGLGNAENAPVDNGVTVTFSATPAFDASKRVQVLTLTGAVTSSTVTGLTQFRRVTFMIKQDGSGSHSFVWPTNVYGGMDIDPTANTVNSQEFASPDGSILCATGIGVTTTPS